jgi:drug/metabolite transporter (DMT)-like permease
MTSSRIILFTVLAMIAFAGNSVLARLALVDGDIGPALFTAIRIAAGAITLILITGVRAGWGSGSWPGGVALLGYAGLFSAAYLKLTTGSGALILFASVQITMIGWAIATGERMRFRQWFGVSLATVGLVWLLLPGLARPDPFSALLMIGSGLCWGVYSLLGQGQGRPILVTAGNFVRATLLGLPILGIWMWQVPVEPPTQAGLAWAILSGAVTSALGYAIWYRALRGLSAARAGIVQLSVPPLAALAGIILLNEPFTVRFVGASAIILFGIALAILRGRVRPYSNSK